MKTVKKISLDKIGNSSKERFWLEMMSSLTATNMCIPVLIAKGKRDGPVLGVTAVLHGNELNGLPVILKLFESIDLSHLSGSIIALPIVNMPGFEAKKRSFLDDKDLNSVMPGKKVGKPSEVFSYNLIQKVLKKVDYSIDLHTAGNGYIDTYYIKADLSDDVNRRMAFSLNPKIIVDSVPTPTTLRGALSALGKSCVTVELGMPHKYQKTIIDEAYTGLVNALIELGMLNEESVSNVRKPVLCNDSYRIIINEEGIVEVLPKLNDIVKKGDVVARVKNIFGDVINEYVCPETGVLIGKVENPVAQSGEKIMQIGLISKNI